MKTSAIVVTIFLFAHHAVAILHGDIHTELEIFLPPYKDLFVLAVLIILPIIALVMIWTRLARLGFLLLMLCMVGALLFDVYHHYILISPDNIAHLPHGTDEQHTRFTWTANVLALLQAIGTILAGYLFGTFQRSHEMPDSQ